MKNRIYSLVFSFALLSAVIPASSFAESVEVQKAGFVSGLRGFESASFFSRIQELMGKYENLGGNQLPIDDAAKERIAAFGAEAMQKLMGSISVFMGGNEAEIKTFHGEFTQLADAYAALILEIFHVDTNGIEDVDTLFERIEARLIQMSKKSDEL